MADEDGLGYGPVQVEILGDEIKRLVMTLEPGEKITFERHDPNEQKDHRWFTVSRPV